MQLTRNKLIISSAGSGKTTFLVKEALSNSNSKIAILTYTNNNILEIKNKFCAINGVIPSRVNVVQWHHFLLCHCARPYQSFVYPDRRIRRVAFLNGRSSPFAPKLQTQRYYLWNSEEIYHDKISEFIIECEKNSNGRVLNRLAGIYDEIYVDEFQDMAGWDFDFIRILLQSRIRVLLVGDPRQYTYRTNDAKKNSQYCGIGILKLASEWASENLCQLENHARSYRCNQKICDYADTLWPDLEPTLSLNYNTTSHDGIFVVASTELHEYIKTFSPAILRYDRRTPAYGFSASNFGVVKGITFGRVLILSHGKIKNYLKSGNVEDVAKSIEKFYVAVTRARFSVAFLYDGVHGAAYTKWEPDSTVPTRLATGSKDPDS